MRIGVPGEFHEDRWQRTAEDSERRVIPRTREASGAIRIQVIAWQSVLLTGLWHGDPTHRCLSSILAWQSVLLTGPRHGDPFHRYLGGILAWRRGLLSTLWHGDPQPKQFWGRVVCRRKGNRYRCRDYGRVHDRVRHGDPTRMHFRAIPAGRTASRPVHDQSLTDLLPITNRCSDRSSAGLSNR